MTLLLMNVGTGALPEGVFTFYALLEPGPKLVELYEALTDTEAVRRAKEAAAGRAIECDASMERAARDNGLAARTLTAGNSAVRAYLAILVFAEDLFGDVREPLVLGDYFETAYLFCAALAKSGKPFSTVIDMRGTIGEVAVRERLGVRVEGGPSASLVAVAEADFERLLGGPPGGDALDRIAVHFKEEPVAVAAALTLPYGLTQIPEPLVIRDGERKTLVNVTAVKLAALLGIVGEHLARGIKAIAWKPRIGGTLELRTIAAG